MFPYNRNVHDDANRILRRLVSVETIREETVAFKGKASKEIALIVPNSGLLATEENYYFLIKLSFL